MNEFKDDLLEQALALIQQSPDFLDKISMPNINFPTMGGQVFWNTLKDVNGWRIQQNTITQHYRILDPNNVRRAWGGIDAMEKIFKYLSLM